VACGLLLVLVACSDSGGTVAPTPQIDESTAIANGDAICKQLAADIDQLVTNFRSTHPSPSADDAREFLVNTLIVRIEHGVGDLHRQGKPTKDTVAYDEAISALDDDLAAFKDAVGADPLKVISAPIKIYDSSASPLKAYGFKECGR
jgi:hypothetical protein